jgi:hypothetical protein
VPRPSCTAADFSVLFGQCQVPPLPFIRTTPPAVT